MPGSRVPGTDRLLVVGRAGGAGRAATTAAGGAVGAGAHQQVARRAHVYLGVEPGRGSRAFCLAPGGAQPRQAPGADERAEE